MSRFHEYQVLGRKLPTATDKHPKIYRMKIFAPNTVVAKSRFWYFLKKFRKVKRATGEIVSVNQIHEKGRIRVKNYGIWLRYDSRSGTINMYKEYREISRCNAVHACYQDMAARHRARFPSIQIIRVADIKASEVRRPYIQQFHGKVRFPLLHNIRRPRPAQFTSRYIASRPTTCK